MKERPILFSAPMVRALLAGSKTQTRRIVKPQPGEHVQATPDVHPTTRTSPYIDAFCGERKTPENPRGMGREWHWWTADNRLGAHVARCPYGQPGDRLWVRESIRRQDPAWDHLPTVASFFIADGEQTKADAWPWKRPALPSIHCPRGLSRITLEVTGVRVERLQAITSEGAKAEGVNRDHAPYKVGPHEYAGVAEYRALWESINGPSSWDANPFVWCVSFKRVAP